MGRGGFFSSLNADSEGMRQISYVWNQLEIYNLLRKKRRENYLMTLQYQSKWELGSGEKYIFRNQSRI